MLETLSKLIKKRFQKNYKNLLNLIISSQCVCVAIKELQEQK